MRWTGIKPTLRGAAFGKTLPSPALAEVAKDALLLMPGAAGTGSSSTRAAARMSGAASTGSSSTRPAARESLLPVLNFAELIFAVLNMAPWNLIEAFTVGDADVATFSNRAISFAAATIALLAMGTVCEPGIHPIAIAVSPAAVTLPNVGDAIISRLAAIRLKRITFDQGFRTRIGIAAVNRRSWLGNYGAGIDGFAATVSQRNQLFHLNKSIKNVCSQRGADGGADANHYKGKPLFHRAKLLTSVVWCC